MNKKALVLLLWVLLLCTINTQAQVGINEDNSQPDASALLDVKSSNKGILIPRMTSTERTNINAPAQGLMVYDNTTNSFWYYAGTAWVEINSRQVTVLSDADNDTKIQVEATADEDSIRIDIGGSERLVLKQNANGSTMMSFPNNKGNVFLGEDAGLLNTTGKNNNFIGHKAGYSNTTGFDNTFLGNKAGYANTTGHNNIFLGLQAGEKNTTGFRNTFIGSLSGFRNTTGTDNIFMGVLTGFNNTTGTENLFLGGGAGYGNQTGNKNVFLGYGTGLGNTSGSGNVFLGFGAGSNETNSNKLYIENSNSSTPLIYGEFDNDLLRINGTLNINNAFSFPTTDGTNGQILTTNGSGTLTWNNPTTPNSLSDADGDTKIQVEESADEDSIRIDIGGSERLVLKQNAGGNTLLSLPNAKGNVFLGQDAGLATTAIGINNSFIGYQAGYANTSGTYNTFFGYEAGRNNLTGNGNLYLGNFAGKNATGTGNVFLGFGAGGNATSSNTLYIENSNSSTPLIYGEFDNDRIGINRVATTNTLEVGGNASKATAGDWLANSDARLKKNIQHLSSKQMLHQLLALQGVTYEWNDTITGNNRPTGIQYGFTAQNIQEVFPTLVSEDNQGYLQTAYGTYDAMYVEAFRALNDKIEQLEQENKTLKSQVNKINQLEAMLQQLQSQLNETSIPVSADK